MANVARLKITMTADDVVVAESTSVSLWNATLSTILLSDPPHIIGETPPQAAHNYSADDVCERCTRKEGRPKKCRFAPESANGAGDQ